MAEAIGCQPEPVVIRQVPLCAMTLAELEEIKRLKMTLHCQTMAKRDENGERMTTDIEEISFDLLKQVCTKLYNEGGWNPYGDYYTRQLR